MEVNEEKRQKFMENAGKRVNNVMHDIQILEPMARSNVYDFTREDVEEMFTAMQGALDSAREEYNRKFEGKAKAEKRVFTFGASVAKAEVPVVEAPVAEEIIVEPQVEAVEEVNV